MLTAPPPPQPAAALVTLAPEAGAQVLPGGATPLWPGSRVHRVPLWRGAGAAQVGRLRRLVGVVAAEPDRVRGVRSFDPGRASQTHLLQIGWSPPVGSRRPLVAVLDTGVDPTVPDLEPVLVPGGARSFVPGSPDADDDPDGHGTHIASVLAAGIGNGLGGSGVAAARVISVRVADHEGFTTTSSIIRGLRYARVRGARVINLSFGGAGRSRLEQDAIDRAVRAGALVVAAAGNTGRRGVRYPAAYRGVLGVGGLDLNGAPLPSSTRGPHVALAAPGREVRGAVRSIDPFPPGTLIGRTGTSMAAAIVSGAAARVLARWPGATPAQVRGLLMDTARDVAPSGADSATGAGALDLAAAMRTALPGRADPEPNDTPPLARRTRALLPVRRASAEVVGRVGGTADPRDAYRVALGAGERLEVVLRGRAGAGLNLVLLRPGAPDGRRDTTFRRRWVVGTAVGPTADKDAVFATTASGVHLLEVHGRRGEGPYRLSARRAPA